MSAWAFCPRYRNFVLVNLAGFAALVVIAAVASLLTVYLQSYDRNLPAVAVACAILGATYLFSVALSIFGAHRIALSVSLGAMSLGLLAMAISINAPDGEILRLIALLLIVSSIGLYRPAIVYQVGRFCTDSRDRHRAFAIYTAIIQLAYVLGPAAADYLRLDSEATWYRTLTMLFAVAGGGFLATLPLLSISTKALPDQCANPQKSNAFLIMVLVCIATFYALQAQLVSVLATLVESKTIPMEIGPWTLALKAGSLASLHGFMVFALSLLCGVSIFKRHYHGALLTAIALVLYAGSFAFLSKQTWPISQWWIVLCFLCFSMAEALINPSLLTIGSRMVGARQGLYWLAAGAGYWTGAILGVLWERWPHSRYLAAISLGCLVVAAGVIWRADAREWE